MLDEIACTNTNKVMDRGKRSETLNGVKPVENMNKNRLGFLEISPTQKRAPSSHKLQNMHMRNKNSLD